MAKIIPLAIILFGILIISFFSYSLYVQSSTESNTPQEGILETDTESEFQSEPTEKTNPLNSLFGCGTERISYSLGSFTTEETCLISSGGECLQKQVICGVTTENLDEISGDFTIKFVVYEQGTNSEELLASADESSFIESHTSYIFQHEFLIEGRNAQKSLVCTAYTLEVPEKPAC